MSTTLSTLPLPGPLIVVLFYLGCPVNISRFVMPVVVPAIYAVLWRWPWASRCKKFSKVGKTEFDAPPAVVLPLLTVGICTPMACGFEYGQFGTVGAVSTRQSMRRPVMPDFEMVAARKSRTGLFDKGSASASAQRHKSTQACDALLAVKQVSLRGFIVVDTFTAGWPTC